MTNKLEKERNKYNILFHHIYCEQTELVKAITENFYTPGSYHDDYYEVIEEDERFKKVKQWLAISPFLADQLKKIDEIVVEVENSYWWGRCTSHRLLYDPVLYTVLDKYLNEEKDYV